MANHDATSPARGNRSALIIVGTFAMLGLAYSLVRVYVLRERIANAQSDIRLLQDANSVLQSNVKELQAAQNATQDRLKVLDGVQSSIGDIHANLGELRGRTEQSQRYWARVEAMYLLRLARDQLVLTRDVPTAIAALEAAAARLADSRDAGAGSAIRTQVDNELRALRAVPQVDHNALYRQLQQTAQDVPRLPMVGVVIATETPAATTPPTDSGLARAWAVLRNALRDLVTVRRAGNNSGALITSNEGLLRQQQLQLYLVNAAQSVQQHQQQSFTTSLQQAVALLDDSFIRDAAEVKALRATLLTLSKQPIAPPLPDISRSLAMLERELPSNNTGAP